AGAGLSRSPGGAGPQFVSPGEHPTASVARAGEPAPRRPEPRALPTCPTQDSSTQGRCLVNEKRPHQKQPGQAPQASASPVPKKAAARPPAWIVDVTDENFEQEVVRRSFEKPVV